VSRIGPMENAELENGWLEKKRRDQVKSRQWSKTVFTPM